MENVNPNEPPATPRSAHRGAGLRREAIELLKRAPALIGDQTPPSKNTRSRRNRKEPAPAPKPSAEAAPAVRPKKNQKSESEKQAKKTPAAKTDQTKQVKKATADATPKKNASITTYFDAQAPPAKLIAEVNPPTPTRPLQDARRSVYNHDLKNTTLGGKAGDLHHGDINGKDKGQGVRMDSPQKSVRDANRWKFEHISPKTPIGHDTLNSLYESSEFSDYDDFMADAAVQTSFCNRCPKHRAWSEMKPVVLIFVLMMFTIIYKGLLHFDPSLPIEIAHTIGLIERLDFLSSWRLEDYLGDIF